MYAVIETGGKQYKVALGDRLKVEKLAIEQGASFNIDRVLMIAEDEQILLGKEAAQQPVQAKVLGHGRNKKIKVFKKRRRKGYRRTQGHRQGFTEIEIVGISDQVHAAVETPSEIAESAESEEPVEKSVAEADEAGSEIASQGDDTENQADEKHE